MAVTTSTEQNKRLARRIPDAVNEKRPLDFVAEVYAADAVEHDPFGDYRGIEAIRSSFETVLDAFPDLSATVEDIVAEGDTVAMRVTLRGTHEGPFAGVEATGRTFEVPNTVFTRIEDGKISERWVQPDVRGMMEQLGIDPGASA